MSESAGKSTLRDSKRNLHKPVGGGSFSDPIPEELVPRDPVPWARIPLGLGGVLEDCNLAPGSFAYPQARVAGAQSQRDCGLQPKVARDELPWGHGPQMNTTPTGVVARPLHRTFRPLHNGTQSQTYFSSHSISCLRNKARNSS